MATFDDLPTLPESGNLSLDDLIGVVDLSDRRSPKRVSLSQLSDLINVTADPTPIATDIDKRLSSASIGEVVNIYGEGSRIEQFVGNLADPSKFFIAGFAPFDVVLIEEDPAASIMLGGFWEQVEPDRFVNDDTGLSAERDDAESPWRLMSEMSAFTLFTASTVTATPQEVGSWIPNPLYPELAEVAAPTLTAWDNSGFTFPIAIFPGYVSPPYAVPAAVYNGRNIYQDSENWGCGYDPAGSEGAGWYFNADVYTYYSPSDAAYPWQAEDWVFIGASEDDPEVTVVITRAPAANNDNWVVLENTVALTVDNSLGISCTVNGVSCPNTEATYVGFVDPHAITTAGATFYVSGFATAGFDSAFSFTNPEDANLAIPIALAPRASVTIYLYD